jgi:hypothetical protein
MTRAERRAQRARIIARWTRRFHGIVHARPSETPAKRAAYHGNGCRRAGCKQAIVRIRSMRLALVAALDED